MKSKQGQTIDTKHDIISIALSPQWVHTSLVANLVLERISGSANSEPTVTPPSIVLYLLPTSVGFLCTPR